MIVKMQQGMTIHKYYLDIVDVQDIHLPEGARVLPNVQADPDTLGINIWAVVNPDAERLLRTFRIFGTGNPIPSSMSLTTYLDTAFMNGFVWHVFADAPKHQLARESEMLDKNMQTLRKETVVPSMHETRRDGGER